MPTGILTVTVLDAELNPIRAKVTATRIENSLPVAKEVAETDVVGQHAFTLEVGNYVVDAVEISTGYWFLQNASATLTEAGVSVSTEGDLGSLAQPYATQVTSAERTAGTETELRAYSPEDIAIMAGIHASGAGITSLLDDTTPQLGGDLDRNGHDILGLVVGVDIQAHSSVLDATTASYTTEEETKLSNISVTQAVDLDTIESDTASNNAKISADGSVGTHSDVNIAAATGSTASTLRILADHNTDGTYDVIDWTPPTGGGGEANTTSNDGVGEGLAKAKSGVDLPFKSLVGGTNVTLTSDADTVTITSSDMTGAEIKAAYEAETNTNAYTDSDAAKVGFISVTQPVDLDTIESDTATNNTKISYTDAAAVSANTAKISADGSVGTHSDVNISTATGSTASTLRILADHNTDGTYDVIDWTPPTGGGGEANTTSNDGAGEGLAKTKTGVDLPFKSLVGGTNVTLTSDADTVTISASSGGSSALPTVTNNTTRTLTTSDMGTRHHCNISSAITITMDAIASQTNGEIIEFVNDAASTAIATLDGNGTEPLILNGYSNLTLPLAPGDSVSLRVDTVNTEWHVIHDGILGPLCDLRRSGTNQNLADFTADKVEYDTVDTDNYDISDTTTNYRITPGVKGWYLVDVLIGLRAEGFTELRSFIYKNGSLEKVINMFQFFNSETHVRNLSTLIEVTSDTDYFEIFSSNFSSPGTPHTFGNYTDGGNTLNSHFIVKRAK